jgi:amino acid adenylation domain-containing protein
MGESKMSQYPRHGEAVKSIPRGADMPVSHSQQRLWFIKQMNPATFVYNVPVILRLKGRIDRPALERVFVDFVTRHEALRTRFVSVDGTPRCVIDAQADVTIEYLSVAQGPSEHREDEAIRLVRELAQRPFDLTQSPLLHIRLVRLSDDEHLLCFVVDHIVADGISVGIILAEFQALYRLHAAGEGQQPEPLPVQYIDYVAYERQRLDRGLFEQHLKYWKNQLAGLPSLLQLPTDRPRPAVQTSNGSRVVEQLSVELSEALKVLARKQRATPYIVLLTAFQVLLHRYTGTPDIATGTAVANRGLAEVERVVGFFANNLVLRTDLSSNPTVREAIARVRSVAMNAYAHEEMPFDMLVDALSPRRELDHSPLFQVLFVLHEVKMTTLELPGLSCEVVEVPFAAARFDLAADVFDLPQGLRIYFEFNTDLFDQATIEKMLRHYVHLLEGFISLPDARIESLEMFAASEVARITRDWNRTELEFPVAQTVHSLFEQQVILHPDSEAIWCGNAGLTYTQLNERANQLARVLRAMGIGRGTLVGIEMERTTELVIGLLAIHKAGAGYVPMDPAFPIERIAYMARDASIKAILTQSVLSPLVPSGPWSVLFVDRERERLAAEPTENLQPDARADDLAYVIYTSGSTGEPKGVEIEHCSVVNFLKSIEHTPGITSADRFVSVTTLSFDIAGLEIFGPLTTGGTVILADRAVALDGAQLGHLLKRCGATILQATPATWRMLVAAGWTGKRDLKALCGGEALPRDLAQALLERVGELWNMYGPTETTVWSTLCKVEDLSRGVMIGRPIANTRAYVFEPSGLPAPIGVAGELCIAGHGLARGYRNRPELTTERFVTVTLPDGRRERVYRTGDMARFRSDGQLEFLGRRDHQVKIRGYRIELEEIEAVLATHAGVRECVVVARGLAEDQRLVGYVVLSEGASFDADAVRATLRAKLPEYMIPNLFMPLPALPLTPNSKIDRNALPAPQAPVPVVSCSDAVMTPAQGRVAAVWRSVLGLERVGLHDNFFDLGGHSLLLVKLHVQLKREFDTQFPLVELFQHATVAAQARLFSAAKPPDVVLKRARARALRQVHG